MLNALYWDAVTAASGAAESEIFENTRFVIASVQISGAFTAASVVLEGRTSPSGPWVALAVNPVDDPDARSAEMTSAGIYEVSVEGVNQLRIRVVSVTGGTVDAGAVLYDGAADGIDPNAPYAERFGGSPLIAAHIAEQIFFNPDTGDIVGYDRVPVTAAIQAKANLFEIAGGMGNRLVGVIPDTVRITGTWKSAAFSFRIKEKIMGGAIAYSAAAPVTETIAGAGGSLHVNRTPDVNLAQEPGDGPICYIRRHGEAKYRGDAYRINPTTGEVIGFTAADGVEYDVLYTAHKANAFSLPVPTAWNPVAMTIQTKIGVYSMRRDSRRAGTQVGWLYCIVPRAILSGDAGFTASQTEHAPTDGRWIAIPEKEKSVLFGDCLEKPVCAQYVYVPCSDETDAVEALAVPGGGMTLRAGETAPIPVKYLMPDDSLVQADCARLGYISQNAGIAEVSNDGLVRGVSAGETEILIFLSRVGQDSIMTRCSVSVTGTARRVVPMADHIIVQ